MMNAGANDCGRFRGTRRWRWPVPPGCSSASGPAARPAFGSRTPRWPRCQTITDRAHRRQKSGIDGTTGECPGVELRALVTMNDGLAVWPTLVNGHAQRVGNDPSFTANLPPGLDSSDVESTESWWGRSLRTARVHGERF